MKNTNATSAPPKESVPPKAEGIGAEARARLEEIAENATEECRAECQLAGWAVRKIHDIILSALSTAIEEEGRGRVSPAAEAPVTKELPNEETGDKDCVFCCNPVAIKTYPCPYHGTEKV